MGVWLIRSKENAKKPYELVALCKSKISIENLIFVHYSELFFKTEFLLRYRVSLETTSKSLSTLLFDLML